MLLLKSLIFIELFFPIIDNIIVYDIYSHPIKYIECPEEINSFKLCHLDNPLFVSLISIGGMFAIESTMPNIASFMVIEKHTSNEDPHIINIRVIISLKFEGKYIAFNDIIRIVYVDINSFWVYIKNDTDTKSTDTKSTDTKLPSFRIIYYYKSSKTDMDYEYTDIVINNTYSKDQFYKGPCD